MNPASISIASAVTDAVKRANSGTQVIDGDSVVDGPLDVLALFVAQSPYMQGATSRERYFQQVEAGLRSRVAVVHAKKAGRRLPGLH